MVMRLIDWRGPAAIYGTGPEEHSLMLVRVKECGVVSKLKELLVVRPLLPWKRRSQTPHLLQEEALFRNM
jgi:hypothetical protein